MVLNEDEDNIIVYDRYAIPSAIWITTTHFRSAEQTCFKQIQGRVHPDDWKEFMRKLGTNEKELKKMYEKRMKRYDMLETWCKKAGYHAISCGCCNCTICWGYSYAL